jgi:LacI family transcriptional regulator
VSVTIRDVAREASVSVATVSRVLNGQGPVREETRRRIRQVAKRLRYVPHGAARSLITRKTSTLGALLPDLFGEFFSEVIRGLDVAARRAGYHLIVSSSHSDRSETEAMLRAMRGRVDGLIVLSPDLGVHKLRSNLPEEMPIVLLNCADHGAFDSILIDNYGGALVMTRHLLALGHGRIAFLRGPAGNHDADERLRGYRHGMRSAPAGWSARLEIPGDFREEAGYRAAAQILAMEPRPDAVFAANDAMAIGLLCAFREQNVRVPEEIALAGFDDIPIARYLTPPLTSVRVPIDELGARAVARMLELLGKVKGRTPRRTSRNQTLSTTLMVRRSSGASPEDSYGNVSVPDSRREA